MFLRSKSNFTDTKYLESALAVLAFNLFTATANWAGGITGRARKPSRAIPQRCRTSTPNWKPHRLVHQYGIAAIGHHGRGNPGAAFREAMNLTGAAREIIEVMMKLIDAVRKESVR